MTKKVYKQKNFFSILIKNLNWEILTKNLGGTGIEFWCSGAE